MVHHADDAPLPETPQSLDADAQRLWRSIVESRPRGFFSAGDEPLLQEYVYTTATLIPMANQAVADDFNPKTLDARDKLVRQAAALARSLRINVASRTRPDTANMRDSVRPPSWVKPWE